MPPVAAINVSPEMSAKSSNPSFYMADWFEWLFLLACLVAGFFVLQWLTPMGLSNVAVDSGKEPLDVVHTIAQGDWMKFFSYFSAQPLYAVLVSIITGLRQFQVGHALAIDEIYSLLVTINLGLYWFSIFMVHWFIRRQVAKPYSYLITILYALAPMTLSSYMALDGGLLFTLLACYTLHWIDRALAKKDHPGFIKKFGSDNLSRSALLIGLSIAASPLGYALLGAFVLSALCSKKVTVMDTIKSTGLVLVAMIPVWGWQLFTVLQGWQGSWSVKLPSVGPSLIAALGQIFVSLTGNGGYQWLQDFPIAIIALLAWLALGVLVGCFRYSGLAAFTLIFSGIMGAVLVGPLPNTAGLFPIVLLMLYWAILQLGSWFAKLKLPVQKVLFPSGTLVILALMGLGFWQAGGAAMPDTQNLPKLSAKELSAASLMDKAKTLVNPEARAESSKAEGYANLYRWMQRNVPSQAKIAGLDNLTDNVVEAKDHYQDSNFTRSQYIIESVSNGNSSSFQTWLNRRERNVQLVYNDTWANVQVWEVN